MGRAFLNLIKKETILKWRNNGGMKMKRKNLISVLIIACLLLFVWVPVNATSGNSYDNVDKISTSDIFVQEEEGYYVYFYRENCPDCNLVKEQILEFSFDNPVYFVDYNLPENKVQSYDWKGLRSKYNKKIGYLDENKEIVFLPEESEEKYENQINQYGKKIIYSYLVVDNDVYTNIMTPEIDYFNITDVNDMVIAGVPTLFYIENHRIKEFYFDSYEVLELINK